MTTTCPDRSVLLISQTTADLLVYAVQQIIVPAELGYALRADGWDV